MDKAQAWADHLADTTSFTHDYDNKYVDGEYIGENIASMGGTGGENGAIDATRMWYCELEDYKKNPGVWSNDPVIGHFTQVSSYLRGMYMLYYKKSFIKIMAQSPTIILVNAI